MELVYRPLSLTFKFEDEMFAYDKMYNVAEAMIKDLIVEYFRWRKYFWRN